jgi:hypothetical protein
MNPNVRPVGQPVIAAHEHEPDGYVTPPPGPRPLRLSDDQRHALGVQSGCRELPELADLLARTCGPEWAVAGSAATRLHAARLGSSDLLDAPHVSSVEVVIRQDPRSWLPTALRQAGHPGNVRHEPYAPQAPASFELPSGLRVYVMQSSGTRWGSIDGAVWHEGVPVISLAALEARTQRDLERAQTELDDAREAGDVVGSHETEAAHDRIACTLEEIQKLARQDEAQGGLGGRGRDPSLIEQLAATLAARLAASNGTGPTR